MKNYEKLLIVMLVITVITTIMTVTVSAKTPIVSITGNSVYIVDIDNGGNVSQSQLQPNTLYRVNSSNPTYAYMYVSVNGVSATTTSQKNPLIITEDTVINIEAKSSSAYTNFFYFIIEGNCDGTTCPATDMNYDNICDDCGNAFTFNLRNDTYNYNGFYLPSAIEDESGIIVNLNNYWNETLSKNEGNLVILNGESTDNALLYHFSPDVVFSDGQVVTTGKTQVTLYKPSTNENGYLYWKKSATDTWNTSGALVASLEHVDWVANAVTDENGYTAINGDVNFQTPLWVEIQGVTEGEMTVQLPKMGGTMKILVACGVGLMACLVALSLFGKRSLIFRN